MRARDALGQDRGAGGLDRHDLDVGVLALEVFAHAGQRTAGADARNEDVHGAVGVVPDLGACGRAVRGGVRGVGELTGDEAVRRLGGQLLRLGNGALHALGALGEHQLRAVGLHQLTALNAHGLRHDDDDAVASCGGDGGKADAGVAAGRLDNDGAGLERTALLGIGDHGIGDTVLDGAGGIEVFELCVDLSAEVFRGGETVELEQGSGADQVGNGIISFHNGKLLLL